MAVKINDLPVATRLPNEDEWVVPICKSPTVYGVNQIPISTLVGLIKESVLSGEAVEMEETDTGGIRFTKAVK